MKKWIYIFFWMTALLLAVSLCLRLHAIVSGQENRGYVIQADAETVEKYCKTYIGRGWKDIILKIQFAPDDTAIIHAELRREQLCELLSVPDWIALALPDALELDLQTSPELDEEDQVVLETVSFSINGMSMPQMVGDAVCTGLAYKVNETFREQGVRLQSLRIESGMLKMETKSSSGR